MPEDVLATCRLSFEYDYAHYLPLREFCDRFNNMPDERASSDIKGKKVLEPNPSLTNAIRKDNETIALDSNLIKAGSQAANHLMKDS